MQIGKIGINSQKSAQQINKNEEVKQLASNPFGVSFKGNVIQADVFESAKQISPMSKISEKSKLFASAVVSGINNFNESFKSRMNSIVSFGKKVTSDFLDGIEKLGRTEISFNMDSIKNTIFPNRQYSVKQLSNKSVDELKTMWMELTPKAV